MVAGLMFQDIFLYIGTQYPQFTEYPYCQTEAFSVFIVFLTFAPMTMVLSWQNITIFGYVAFGAVFAVVAMIIGVAVSSAIEFQGPPPMQIPVGTRSFSILSPFFSLFLFLEFETCAYAGGLERE